MRQMKELFPPSNSVTEDDSLEVKYIKEEEEVNDLEHVLKKEKQEIEEGECEAPVKHAPLFRDDPVKVEDVKALGGADAGASGSSSAFVVELPACSPVMREDGGALGIALGSVMKNGTSYNRNNKGKEFSCGSCEYKSKWKGSVQRHLLTHKRFRDKPFACNHCKYKTDVKCNLGLHLRTHDSVRVGYKSFACNQCKYKTHNKSFLRVHLLTHKSVKDEAFVCNYCEYRTDFKSNLRKHLRTHMGVRDKPFACNDCNYKTDSKCNLRKHLRTHEGVGDKPFVCNHCNYKTSRKYILRKHLLTHESVR